MRWSGGRGLVVVALLAAGPATGAGLRDLADGWLLPAPCLASLMVPSDSGTPARSAWGSWCALGAGRLYEMPELPLRAMEIGVDRFTAGGVWRARGMWQILGGDLYRTARWTLEGGREGPWRLRGRLAGESEDLEGVPGPRYQEADVVLGREVAVPGGARVVVDLHLPVTGTPAAAVRRVRPVARIRVVAAPAGLVLAWDRRGDGTALLGLEATLGLGPAGAILLRFDGGSGSLGPGLAVRAGAAILRTSHAVHPVLGVSHRFQVVFAAGGVRVPRPEH